MIELNANKKYNYLFLKFQMRLSVSIICFNLIIIIVEKIIKTIKAWKQIMFNKIKVIQLISNQYNSRDKK